MRDYIVMYSLRSQLVAGYHLSFIHFISLGEGFSRIQVKAEYLIFVVMVVHCHGVPFPAKGIRCMVVNTVGTGTYMTI
jgi:hypothetical protein